jgi:kynurenine formamidase
VADSHEDTARGLLAGWIGRWVGADAPSVDSFNEVAVRMIQPVHMMCRERGVLNIESLRNIDLIPKRAFTFVGLPLKIRNGCGSPGRSTGPTAVAWPSPWVT